MTVNFDEAIRIARQAAGAGFNGEALRADLAGLYQQRTEAGGESRRGIASLPARDVAALHRLEGHLEKVLEGWQSLSPEADTAVKVHAGVKALFRIQAATGRAFDSDECTELVAATGTHIDELIQHAGNLLTAIRVAANAGAADYSRRAPESSGCCLDDEGRIKKIVKRRGGGARKDGKREAVRALAEAWERHTGEPRGWLVAGDGKPTRFGRFIRAAAPDLNDRLDSLQNYLRKHQPSH